MLAVVTAGLVLLVFRRPSSLVFPTFWAEDGAVFYQEQVAPGSDLLSVYNGYLHLAMRVIAAALSWLPPPLRRRPTTWPPAW